MSANRNVANLSVAVVKTLVRMTPFAAVADTIDSAQECLNLLADIKNNALDNPNAEMIRSLNSAVKSEIKSIEDALKQDGMSRKLIKDAVAQLSEAARDTIKELAEDNNALIQAVQQPENFGAELKKHAARHSDGFNNIMQAHYTTLLDRITQEFLILAPWSPNFNRFALTSLLRCFPALSERIDRLEQQINEGFNSVREDAAAHHQDLKNDLASIYEDLRNKTTNSRPTKLEDEVWGSRPATLKHWIERDPTSNGTTLHDTIFSSPSSQRGSRCVLVGRAGSGKTSLAASIASRCESDTWSLVAWIDASTRSNIESGLIALGEAILGTHTNVHQEQRLRIEQVLASFKRFGKNKCLFVYDNAEGLDYLDGVLPVGPGVDIVVTTRHKNGWSNQAGWIMFDIGNFSRAESIKHLLSVTEDIDLETADKIASYLGDLPLAVTQAAATCSRYYSNLQDYYADLQATNIEELLEPIEGGHYSKGAIASLQLATHSALNFMKDPLVKKEAEGILAVLCYLAESGVPTKWLKYNNGLPSRKAFKLLQDASIIDQSNDGRITSIHRLLAHALRESWTETESMQAAEATATLLGRVNTDAIPRNDTKSRWRDTRDLMEQILAIFQQDYSGSLFDFKQVRNLLNEFIALHEESLQEDILDLGPYHPYTLNTSDILAVAYRRAGRLDEAIQLCEWTLGDCILMLGEAHPLTVTVRENLEAAKRELEQQAEDSANEERVQED